MPHVLHMFDLHNTLTEMACQSLSSLRRLGCGRGRMENGRMFIFIAQVHCKLCHQNKKYKNPLSNQNFTSRYNYNKSLPPTNHYHHHNKYHDDENDDDNYKRQKRNERKKKRKKGNSQAMKRKNI